MIANVLCSGHEVTAVFLLLWFRLRFFSRGAGVSKAALAASAFIGEVAKALATLSLTLANFERAHRLRWTRNIGSFSTIS